MKYIRMVVTHIIAFGVGALFIVAALASLPSFKMHSNTLNKNLTCFITEE